MIKDDNGVCIVITNKMLCKTPENFSVWKQMWQSTEKHNKFRTTRRGKIVHGFFFASFKKVAIPTLSYSSASQIIRVSEERISVEMHFMLTAGYTLLECKGYKELMRELEIPQLTESIE